MIYTLVGDAFDDFVQNRVQEHHAKLQDKAYVEMDPEVANILRNSNAVSCKYQVVRTNLLPLL